MNRFKRRGPFSVLFLILLSLLLISGCAKMVKPDNVTAEVACDTKIEWDLTKDVEVTSFACTLGKHAIDPALIFTMELKNVTSNPLRYRVGIFLMDMDKAAGHLVPRKGKPPVVKPGETAKVKIPFIKTEKMSKKILVKVSTLS